MKNPIIIVFCALIVLPFVALIFSGYMEKRDRTKRDSGITEFQNFKDAFGG